MARKKRKGNGTELAAWQSAAQNCMEDRYAALGGTLLKHKPFNELNGQAKFLYLCMCYQCGGHSRFTFTYKAAEEFGFCPTAFRNSVRELEDAHFIRVHRQPPRGRKKEATLYEFDFAWRAGLDSSKVAGSDTSKI